MDNPVVRKTNIFSTVLTIYVPLIFVIVNISDIFMIFGNSIIMILTLIAFSILGVVCYISSLVQGFRAIGNGKVGTYKSASKFQVILYLVNSILSIICIIHNRNNSYNFIKNANKIFLVIFALFIILALVRLTNLKDKNSKDIISVENPGLAWKLIGLFIVLPIVFIIGTILLYRLLENNEKLRRIIMLTLAIGFLIFVIGLGLFILGLLANSPFFGDASGSGGTNTSRSSNARNGNNRASNADIGNLDNLYRKEFKNITGSSPDSLDWKIMKDGAKLDAVKGLRRNMQGKAKSMGASGKSKYF